MNIGFVSTWFERGAAYVTKAYADALSTGNNNIFVYARGGEKFAKDDDTWNQDHVTWGRRLSGTNICRKHLYKWIRENKIDVVFFNEQHEFSIVAMLKKDFKDIKIGSYIDYYKENTIELFNIYDFIICNTMRHYEAFVSHKQKYYVPWGTDIKTFKPSDLKARNNDRLVFFHSAGMSNRKGTDLLIEAYVKGKLYKKSELIIHTQIDIEKISGYKANDLQMHNIQLIEKTVSAPGLYHLGDVYVYPTRLEGLGLTTFEALSCGLPVIITDNAPMNEVVNDEVGKLVEVKRFYSRGDGYYWPMAECSITDLINKMNFYIKNSDKIVSYKENARKYAERKLNWKLQYDKINEIFKESSINEFDADVHNNIINTEKRNKLTNLRLGLISNNWVYHIGKTIVDSRNQ